MRYVLIPLSLIGFAYGMMHDFVWLELLTGGYLTSAILLGSSDYENEENVFWDWTDNNDFSWDNDSSFGSDDWDD